MMEIERDICGSNISCPEGMVGNRKRPRRPGLGLVYNISPFTLIQKNEKTMQAVPVDFTVLDHISDPDAFTKKAYELEAAVAETEKLGGEPIITGERVFRRVEDDQPRRRRPGLGPQLEWPKFIALPMRPLPAKVHCASACQTKALTQSTNSSETTKVKALSGPQNEASSSISSVTKEAPEMNLHASSSLQRLLSVLENCSEGEEKAVGMVFECLNLKPTVISPLVVPEMPKFARLCVVRSPCELLPSIERVRELRREDPLVAFEEFKKKFFARSPITDYSDNDTNPLVGVASVRSLSSSPGRQISFENEVPEMSSGAGAGNISNEDFADYEIPGEPDMGSPWENSPVNIEVPLSDVPLENSHVNTEEPPSDVPLENSHVNTEEPPSDVPLENQPEEEVVHKEASSKRGKKRGLDYADSSLDMHSKSPVLAPESNTETHAKANLVDPPRERDEMTPPKKRKKNKRKTRTSIPIVEGGLQEVGGVRRSTRIRSRPLRHWMGERFLYGCSNDGIPATVGVKECSPATSGIRVKVKSFVSDELADLVAWLAK